MTTRSTTLSPELMVCLGQGEMLGKKLSEENRTRKTWERGTDLLVRIRGPVFRLSAHLVLELNKPFHLKGSDCERQYLLRNERRGSEIPMSEGQLGVIYIWKGALALVLYCSCPVPLPRPPTSRCRQGHALKKPIRVSFLASS